MMEERVERQEPLNSSLMSTHGPSAQRKLTSRPQYFVSVHRMHHCARHHRRHNDHEISSEAPYECHITAMDMRIMCMPSERAMTKHVLTHG